MTSAPGPGDDRATTDLHATRRLLDELRRSVNASLDTLTVQLDALTEGAQPAGPPRRPASVAPRRMEQMVRTPEPTADLDDLVDVLAPRLLERLVPALRDALRDDR